MENIYPAGMIQKYVLQMVHLQNFNKKNATLFNTLTRREIEVLILIAEGLKNTDISKELNITFNTVQNHRASIREKLAIETQADYIKYALAFDLITF